MFRLFETIAVENFNPENLGYHQQRMDDSYRKLFKTQCHFNLKSLFVELLIPDARKYKWRFDYSSTDCKSTVELYIPKVIQRVEFVEIPSDFDYALKYVDRTFFSEIRAQFSEFDEVIMTKNGFLTDSTIANIVVQFKNDSQLYTPITPLLCGTYRKKLLEKNFLIERMIHIDEIKEINNVFFINAMLPFDESKGWNPKNNDLKSL